jgi:formate dehydrogenase
VKLMADGVWDQGLLRELGKAMTDASICGLGQAAPNPMRAAMKFFQDELA